MPFKGLTLILIIVLSSNEIQPAHNRRTTMPPVSRSRRDISNKFQIEYCSINSRDTRSYMQNDSNLTIIYFVTPTYPRPEQIPELTRLAHTLMHVPCLHWIVADDNVVCSRHVHNILKRSGLPYTHISSPMPDYTRGRPVRKIPPKGVPNRRAALHWIHSYVNEGILYFGDDDNTYDLELFSEIRKTRKLSMLPVGFVGAWGVSAPIVDVDKGLVVAFFDSWFHKRKFPVDMAGFAVNIKHLSPTADMPFVLGMLEDGFLKSAGFNIEDIEPLADNCTKVLVWHTRTRNNKLVTLQADVDYIKSTKYKNLGILLEDVAKQNVVKLNPQRGTKTGIIQNFKHIFNWGYVRKFTSLPEDFPANHY